MPEVAIDSLSSAECLALLEISHTINSTLDIQQILNSTLQQLSTVIEASASTIWLSSHLACPKSTVDEYLYVAAATGEKSEQIKDIHVEIGQGIVGRVVKNGQSTIVDDVSQDRQHAKDIADQLDFEVLTMMCVPITYRDQVIGAIQALNKFKDRGFSQKDLFLTRMVADATGIALYNADLHLTVQVENRELRRSLGSQHIQFRDIIAVSPNMKHSIELSARVAGTPTTTLLRGESGTGKELVAHAIHNASPRERQPFIPVNCAALPDTLLEAELFGHEKGAFTGADSLKEGRFELANNGTLFLDEIGDMNYEVQAKLVRVLQDQEFYRVGGTKPIQCDVRLIAATNQDLEAKIQDGTFREDLYYRLNVIEVFLPPLRERIEDIPSLADFFLQRFGQEMKRPKKCFSTAALEAILTYSWPGNVRELQNVVEHAVVLGKDVEVQVEDLPARFSNTDPDEVARYQSATLDIAQRAFKRQYVTHVLQQTEGNRSRAAKVLDIQRTYLSRLIKELQIDG